MSAVVVLYVLLALDTLFLGVVLMDVGSSAKRRLGAQMILTFLVWPIWIFIGLLFFASHKLIPLIKLAVGKNESETI